jgi:hypothetical protein
MVVGSFTGSWLIVRGDRVVLSALAEPAVGTLLHGVSVWRIATLAFLKMTARERLR